MKLNTSAGSPFCLGAQIVEKGVNFALFSRHADQVKLALFEHSRAAQPSIEIELDPRINRTGDIWHIAVEGIGAGMFYGFKVSGAHNPREGLRFYPRKVLLDPYTRAVTDIGGVPKGVVVNGDFDWDGTLHPRTPLKDTVIYETHVKGFTCHPSSGVEYPGAYRGVIEKIPYLKELGITAVEFLPLQEFNHRENIRINPETGVPIGNYWGYSPIAFFAPKGSYSASGDTGEQVVEFKEMVRELHRAGIEVILDVVFNHTAEMNYRGSLYSFRGLDNPAYYILRKDKRQYRNLTGCGNTVNCNHPAVTDMIIDCLRYWVSEMRVDGFRFDLATIFHRSPDGEWLENPPVIDRITNDPVLAEAKLISEPWDPRWGYRVGNFGGARWCDWNDRCRDDVRRFWRGDRSTVGAFATRIAGSSDLFRSKGSPLNSINFVTCHDGFTLWDLNCYEKKRNRGNGHNNRDGASHNFGFNFGVEGETDNETVNELRIRQAKNFFATLMLSQGVPMILGGDEFLRTQRGNNNAYCQDNDIAWYNWDLLKENAEFNRFCRMMIAFRTKHPALRRAGFFKGEESGAEINPDIRWYSFEGAPADWKPDNRRLACLIKGNEKAAEQIDNDIFIAFNSADSPIEVRIPHLPPEFRWYRAVDTGNTHPDDIYPVGSEPSVSETGRERMELRSLLVLIAKSDG